ncbi:hypothetical protein FKW77_001727 [Venturia effusa]|uniref:Rhodopsin domain-containing protein n=1 Tax=Venturia effusa TaxID=50376 RepID=A0A517LNE9_9PEZI|nr:hypothetical protein FKW77_001727 [Venturia effusa]
MAKSALIGYPPATDQDYWIAKYMIRTLGIKNGNASRGFTVTPPRPPADEYHFETRAPGLIAGLSICIVVMAGITGLRLYLRFFTPRLKSGLDDWLIIPGVILALAYPALQLAMVVYGGSGKHLYDCSYQEQYFFKYLAAIAQIVFFVSIGIVKMSITAFNMRLTGFSSSKWMIAHWSFFVIIVCYTLIALALTIFSCDPIWSSFDIARSGKLDKSPICLGVRQIGTILRAINITLDYCLLLVPVIVLSTVQMDVWRKIKLVALFCVGGLACIGSVLTLVAKDNLKSDVPWNFNALLGWSLLELTLGVTAASLPVLGALLTIFPRSTGSPPVVSDYRDSYHSTRPIGARPSLWSRTSKHVWCKLSVRKHPNKIKLSQARTNHPPGFYQDSARGSQYSDSIY